MMFLFVTPGQGSLPLPEAEAGDDSGRCAEHDVDWAESFMVGDRWRDVEAGQNAGCRTVFIDGGYEEQQPMRPADARVHSLKEAADWILQACRKEWRNEGGFRIESENFW